MSSVIKLKPYCFLVAVVVANDGRGGDDFTVVLFLVRSWRQITAVTLGICVCHVHLTKTKNACQKKGKFKDYASFAENKNRYLTIDCVEFRTTTMTTDYLNCFIR